ncbi:capsular polysaccharide biosynthesis protein CapF [Enterovibrio sp. ZSDZ42]|uniref:Capsular polysaccharide biosynthesis protein CapF n=1 Tax=Enterovibrio gelatinilyticus TaxID=2899819 RepID=A0ABT5QWI3_9GAMM|nr:capsular polysaccharide biosynthesis protein CapF [Enterovibrio sp. ZSDZ42]MDD1792380.1 capsular polysaccharide biosynthesis protein CapF [Enterovibrio sp. ZSDZ42]
MKILVTGAKGFIGKNLTFFLTEQGFSDLICIDRDSSSSDLADALLEADFVFHLAGVNRPKDDREFKEGNTDLTQKIIDVLQSAGKKTPLLITSSIHAEGSTAYGRSKAGAEEAVLAYGRDTGADVFVYRLPNVFGKWCRPNYNSAVATFCHNVANDLPLTINDESAKVSLVYIDDVCDSFCRHLSGTLTSGIQTVETVYPTTVGEIAGLLYKFKESRDSLIVENVGVGLERALYSTYISYFKPSQFTYTVPSYQDPRGTFCELLKTKEAGQVSFFTAHPGITRGGHYHHTKNEKFLVIKGQANFKFQQIESGEFYEEIVSGDDFRVVETVPGWTHDVTNIGEDELIVMLWANEVFDREKPDTFARVIE